MFSAFFYIKYLSNNNLFAISSLLGMRPNIEKIKIEITKLKKAFRDFFEYLHFTY